MNNMSEYKSTFARSDNRIFVDAEVPFVTLSDGRRVIPRQYVINDPWIADFIERFSYEPYLDAWIWPQGQK